MCALPFMHYSIKPNNQIKPCCRFMTFLPEHQEEFSPISVETHSPYEALNSAPMERIRQAMLKGEHIPGCNKCYKEEQAMKNSMRTTVNELFGVEQYLDGHIELRYLEVAFGNYCNLSCRTCGSGLSTSWHDDDLKLKKHYPDRENAKPILDVNFNWKATDFDLVEEIKFTGGEPMLHPNFIKFLDIIINGNNETHITLDIFTNTSWTPKAKVIDRLKKFKKVKIWLSIDGVGSTQDYVRNGSTWDKVHESADTWCQLEREFHNTFSIILTPTLNMYNVINFMDVVEWWISLRNKHSLPFESMQGRGDIVTSIVHFPDSLNIKNLPNKEYYINRFKNYCDNFDSTLPEFKLVNKIAKTIIMLLTQHINENIKIIEFVQFTKDLDKLRSQSFQHTNLELYRLIETHLNEQNTSYNNINGRLND